MVKTLPDFVGANSVQQLANDAGQTKAAWIQFIVTGTGTARIGDSATSSTQGLPVPAGGGMFFPWRKQPEHDLYALSQFYMYIPTGASIAVAYSTD